MNQTASAGELFGHPKGLYVLFFTEMWERFCFYSMRAFVVIYMTQALLFSDRVATGVYGAYLGFGYAATFIGGMLADRLLGQRRAIFFGATVMALAQFALVAHSLLIPQAAADGARLSEGLFGGLNMVFFLALAFFAAGNGFFKPNISTIVGTLYPQGDPRRDGAFLIFYMGINIGAAMAGISGQIAPKVGWHWGFLLAGIGMVLSQIVLYFGRNLLQGKGLPPREHGLTSAAVAGIPNFLSIGIGVMLFGVTAAYLISNPTWVQDLAIWLIGPVLVYLIWEAFRGTVEERGRMIVLIIMCMFSMTFWAFFELAGSSINLFADRHVDLNLPAVGEVTSSAITAVVNPVFIILFCMVFAKLWVWLAKRQMEPSSPLKFALGLVQLGAGFFVMYLGAVQAGPDGRCNVMYLVVGFLLHTTGELCLSPVGLSTVTKLAPARLVGMFMGVWFLFTALGYVVGGKVGGFAEDHGFEWMFWFITKCAVAAGILLGLISPFLKKLMHGVK